MLRFSILVFLLVTPVWAGVTGVVHVIDGDTFDVGDTRVRLHAIDAPETDQMCGSDSSPAWNCGMWVQSQARALFEGKFAQCTVRDTDRYGRTVAVCSVDGQDMGALLATEGLAFAYRRYGLDYDLAEKQAAVQGRGLHATGVTSPAAFRAAKRAAARPDLASRDTGAKHVKVPQPAPERRNWLPNALNPACKIKGNVSYASGERIFHVPGQEYYSQTRISITRGERWFCSEAEARAAGWRKARN